jgi:hypothetical protein
LRTRLESVGCTHGHADLDEHLYHALVAKELREQHEAAPLHDDSPLSPKNPLGAMLVTRWCWIIFYVDVFFMAFSCPLAARIQPAAPI